MFESNISTQTRPIVFVAYDFGALLLKQVCSGHLSSSGIGFLKQSTLAGNFGSFKKQGKVPRGVWQHC